MHILFDYVPHIGQFACRRWSPTFVDDVWLIVAWMHEIVQHFSNFQWQHIQCGGGRFSTTNRHLWPQVMIVNPLRDNTLQNVRNSKNNSEQSSLTVLWFYLFYLNVNQKEIKNKNLFNYRSTNDIIVNWLSQFISYWKLTNKKFDSKTINV